QDVADVAKLNLDVVLVPEEVIDLDARQADVPGVDGELRGVKVEDGVPVHQLPAEGIVTADGVNFLPGILRHGHHLPEHLLAPQGQVPAADVQAGHEQVAARGGLGQVDDLAHV